MITDRWIFTLLQNPALAGLASLASRAGMALIFLMAGWGKLTGYAQTAHYMQAMGVSPSLLPLTLVIELGGGLALLLGLWTRSIAALLAGFCLITALIFHHQLSDPTTFIMFMKNLAMAGGLLQLVIHGAGALALDRR